MHTYFFLTSIFCRFLFFLYIYFSFSLSKQQALTSAAKEEGTEIGSLWLVTGTAIPPFPNRTQQNNAKNKNLLFMFLLLLFHPKNFLPCPPLFFMHFPLSLDLVENMSLKNEKVKEIIRPTHLIARKLDKTQKSDRHFHKIHMQKYSPLTSSFSCFPRIEEVESGRPHFWLMFTFYHCVSIYKPGDINQAKHTTKATYTPNYVQRTVLIHF